MLARDVFLPACLALAILTPVAPRAVAAPLFATQFLSFDASPNPYSVAIGDLNADGKPDLVTSNVGSNTVSVLLGNGDGTFGVRTDYGTGSQPYSVAIHDLNADGKLDLVTADYGSNTVSVLIGNGDGSFGTETDYDAGIQPYSVAIGDVNADGKPDLAVANPNLNGRSGTVSVLLGNGDGTFGVKTDIVAGVRPFSVAIGDLNADGKLDLAVANIDSYGGPGTVSVLLGNGDGSFGSKTDYGTGISPNSVAIGDLNGDGRPDLAVANLNSNTVSVLLGHGDGSFGLKADFVTGNFPISVAIGDLNADGKPDLALADLNSYAASVLLGNGDGSFGVKADYAAGNSPYSVAIGDLNADGKLDLAVAAPGSNAVSVLLGNGDGSFGARTEYGAGHSPRSVAIGDLNGDGKPDLAAASLDDDAVSVLLGDGDGRFGPNTPFRTGSWPSSVAIGDMNGDGIPDLVVANSNSNTGSVLLGNGDGSFRGRTDFAGGYGPVAVAVGDLNGDGKLDVATADYYSSTVSVLLGNGDGRFGARAPYGTGGQPYSVAMGDLNGDGKLDLTTANRSGNTVSVLLGNGDGTFGTKTDLDTGPNPQSVAIGDLNADGKLDLVTANAGYAGTVSVLLGNGNGTFGGKTDFVTGNSAISAAIGNLDGDGKPDLAVANYYTSTISVLLGHGDGSFGEKTDYNTGLNPWFVAIGDLNGDTKPDLVAANSQSSDVTVLLNIGRPPVSMVVDLDPNTLNLKSLGRWITCYLEPPAPLTADQIDVGSVRLNGVVPVDPAAPTAIGDHDGNGISDLMVKFDRAAVELAVHEGPAVTVTVTGRIDGQAFSGTDVIRAKRAVVNAPAAGAAIAAGSVTSVLWETPSGVSVASVAMLYSADDGVSWTLQARDLPNAGRYDWTVPAVSTHQARVAVVLVESPEATGDVVTGVLGTSGRFSIPGATGVQTPGIGFTLRGATPNPAWGRFNVEFSLPDARPASLAIYDVTGRQVALRAVGGLGPGRHVIESEDGRLPTGVYVIRLSQGGRVLTTRAALIHLRGTTPAFGPRVAFCGQSEGLPQRTCWGLTRRGMRQGRRSRADPCRTLA